LAERFSGWTLEYIDGLSVADVHELIQIDEGREKARPKPKNTGQSGPRPVMRRRGRR
jgi:hypothetical protein